MRNTSVKTMLLVIVVCWMTFVSAVRGQVDNSLPSAYYADWSRDGSTIAVANINGLTIYNADFSVRSTWEPSDPNETQQFYDLSPNGNRILTEGAVWDTFTLQPVFTTSDYYLVDWSADSNLILAVPLSELGFVTLSASTGEVTQTYMDGTYSMNLIWSPDNQYFAGSDNFQNIYLVDRETGNERLLAKQTKPPFAFAWHPDSTMFMFAENTGPSPNLSSTVYTFDIQTGEITPLITIEDYTARLRWSPDGHQFIIDTAGTLYVVDALSLEYKVYVLPATSINVIYSPSGGQVMLNYQIYDPPEPSNADGLTRNNFYISHSLANGAVQIIVPDPSPERLQAIAAACDAPPQVVEAITAAADTQAPATLSALTETIETLPEGTIPPGCAADLIAVAEALAN